MTIVATLLSDERAGISAEVDNDEGGGGEDGEKYDGDKEVDGDDEGLRQQQ